MEEIKRVLRRTAKVRAAPMLVLAILCACVAAESSAAGPSPVPLLDKQKPVDWWFVFKFNAKSFPGCASGQPACPFGGDPVTGKPNGQQWVVASSANRHLQQGDACVGDTDADPVGATFGQVYRGGFFYVVWNDQFYKEPAIANCGDSCGAPWGHSKGMLAWDADGNGLVMQVTTPSWPAAGGLENPRGPGGNTLGCVTSTNNVLVSQHFFALRLTKEDVANVLKALALASVVTNPADPQIVKNGGPPELQTLVTALGRKTAETTVMRVQLSSGVGLLVKPSALHVPPWQFVSAQLGRVPLRVASWWTHPAIDSTSASTDIGCWDAGLPKPGPVQIATSGSWQGTAFGLKGGPGPDFNHAKFAVSTAADHKFVIFGDMNQQGVLSGADCGRSQNARGGLFFILDDATLAESVAKLIDGGSSPVPGAGQ